MAKYDGLIIPRSYNDYINKSNPIDVSQALQLTGVMDNAPAAQSTKPAKSGGIFAANAVIMADSATLSGVAISAGSVVRVLFTADLTGSDATTGLTLTYNGTAYAVKVGKNGALANFNAYEVESGVFKYLQAYTTLELMFDGTQFIIIGNPVVLSNADYTIYPDGSIKYNNISTQTINSLIGVRHLQATGYTSSSRGKTRIIELNYADIGYYNSRVYFLSDQRGNINIVVVGRNDNGISILSVRTVTGNTENMLDNIFITTQNSHVAIAVVVHSDKESLMSVDSPMGDLVSISNP